MLGYESFLPAMMPGDSGFTAALFKILTFMIGAIGFALCFFGYKLQRVYIAIVFGLILGGLCVGVSASVIGAFGSAALLLGILGFAIGVVIGYKCFKAITALTYALLGFGIAYALCAALDGNVNELSVTGLIVGLLAAGGLGFLVHKFYRPFVIITSSLQGAALCVNGFAAMIEYDGFVDYTMSVMGNAVNSALQMFGGQQSSGANDGGGKTVVMLLLLGLGIFFQWKTAGQKVLDFFRSVGAKVAAGSSEENAVIAAEGRTSHRALVWLSQPLALPDMKYLNLCLMLGAGCGLLSLLRTGGLVLVLATLMLVAAIVLLLLQKRGIAVSNAAVNTGFLLAAAMFAVVLIQLLFGGASFFALLTPAATQVFLVAFWLVATKRYQGSVPFLISAGLAAVQLIFYIINGMFGLLELSILVLNLPFILPTVQQYTAALPQQAARLNDALRAPQAPVQTEKAEPQQTMTAKKEVTCAAPVHNPTKAEALFCAHCGNKLVEGAPFCTKCGAKVEMISISNIES